MGVLIALMFLGLALWLGWSYLSNDGKTEAVSRDLEDAMTDEAIARVKEELHKWKSERMQ
jgi:hypothetical protein